MVEKFSIASLQGVLEGLHRKHYPFATLSRADVFMGDNESKLLPLILLASKQDDISSLSRWNVQHVRDCLPQTGLNLDGRPAHALQGSCRW